MRNWRAGNAFFHIFRRTNLSKKGYRFVKMHKNNFVTFLRYACLFDCLDKGFSLI